MTKYAIYALIATCVIELVFILIMKNHITSQNAYIDRLENNIKQLEQSNTSIDLQQDRIRNQLLQVNNELEACYSSKNKLANDLADVEDLIKSAEPIYINTCEVEAVDNETRNTIVDIYNKPIGM